MMCNDAEYRLHCAIVEALPQHREALARTLRRIKVSAAGCWEWQGARREKGYGCAHYPHLGGRNLSPHRFVMLALGHDLDGKIVCHHCDNPPCINPDHLFVGTYQDNANDAMEKGRAVLPPRTDWPSLMRGRPHHWQKLNRDDIGPIRARLSAGEKLESIAKDYGVSFQAISKIKTGTRWGHIP